MKLKTRRVYDAAQDSDGFRLLVDRLWPRGLTKENARVDLWLKDVSPSRELRQRFHHDASLWDEFRSSYFAELQANPEGVAALRAVLAGHDTVTLLYGARDESCNNAVALKEFIENGYRP